MPTGNKSTLRDMLVGIYSAKGASAEEAETVARQQVGANLVGHDSHGISSMTTESDPAFVSKPPPDGYGYAGAWIRQASRSKGTLFHLRWLAPCVSEQFVHDLPGAVDPG